MIENAVILNHDGEPIYWHLPNGRTSISIPDSRSLWEIIWEHREDIQSICHSHPGSGIPYPSYTDVTTFSAIELALGKKLLWYIITKDYEAIFEWEGPEKYDYIMTFVTQVPGKTWAQKLRDLSYGEL